jgi:hypothetical protein
MDPSVRRAIARIEITHDNAVIRRGTACLVGPRLVLTALHVVADRTTDPPEFFRGGIVLTFTEQFSTAAAVLDGKWNSLEDWVLLTCGAAPPDTEPLPLGTIARDGVSWMSYGFPDAEHEGLTIHGTVTNSHGELHGGRVAAYQLYSPEVAAAKGLKAKGLSGAPVIVGNAAIGVIRRAPMDGTHAQAGTLFACPVTLVARQSPEHLSEPMTIALAPAPLVAGLRRSATLLASTLLLAFVFVYVYRALATEPPNTDETVLFVIVAGIVVFTTAGLRRRSTRNRGQQ